VFAARFLKIFGIVALITTCLPGDRYGRLVVLAEAESQGSPRKRRYVPVKCDCRIERVVSVECLRSGHTKSCGCYNREMLRNRATHGKSKAPLYKIWCDIHYRCENPNSTGYHNYGGRGITVCRAWRKFEPFQSWAITNGYIDGLTIERQNNNKNYTPSNCRWATYAQQNRNRRYRKNKSGYLGVEARGERWRVQVSVAYKRVSLGTFDDPFSAAWVRDEFVTQLYEHATTNNLIDRRKRKKLVMLERRGTFKRKVIV